MKISRVARTASYMLLVFFGGFPASANQKSDLKRTDETPANHGNLHQQPSIKMNCFCREYTNEQMSLEGY